MVASSPYESTILISDTYCLQDLISLAQSHGRQYPQTPLHSSVAKIANSSMKADITRIERIIRIANTSRISRKEALVSLESKISSDEH